ncbi:DnaB-like helicase C-terminal domain-containing protein [Nocardioides sp. HB32]
MSAEMVEWTPEPTEYDEPSLPVEFVRLTPAEQAITNERNRRNAIEVVNLEKAARVPTRTGRVKMRNLVAQAVTELEVRREHGLTGLKTGVPSFDKVACPLFQPSRVVGVAASTKVGKTTLLWQWAVAFAVQDIPVMIFSFEDEGTDSVYRGIANISSGDVAAIRAGFVVDGEKTDIPEAFDEGAETLADLDIEVSNTPATCEQLGHEVGDWKKSWPEGKHAGVVIVDQLSHLVADDPATFAARWPGFAPPPPRDNLVQLLEWQTAMLQRIGRRWNVLVIVAHQLNENAKEHEEPSERSLRNSRGIAHKLDGLVIPWRPSRLLNPNPGPGLPETVPNDEQRMWLCVPIARQIGGGFKVEVEWQGTHQRVADLGTGLGTPWTAPEKASPEKLAGMAAYADVRRKWQNHVDAVQDAANGVGEAPKEAPVQLRAIGTLGAKWALPAAPVPAAPAEPEEFTGVDPFGY